MSETYSHIEEACKIILSATFDLQAENDKYKNIFNLKSVMFKSVSDENAKLKRLLAEACFMVGNYRMSNFASKELEQWYAEYSKQEENK